MFPGTCRRSPTYDDMIDRPFDRELLGMEGSSNERGTASREVNCWFRIVVSPGTGERLIERQSQGEPG